MSSLSISMLGLLLSVLLMSVIATGPSAPLRLTGITPFSTRCNPQLATVGGRLYLQGGINPSAGETYGDTYLSDDGGTSWSRVASSGAPVRYSGALINFPQQTGHAVQLYLFAGADNLRTYNDVYLSQDGTNFSSLGLTAFSSRQSFAYATAASIARPELVAPTGPAIFVLGGYGQLGSGGANTALNDVSVKQAHALHRQRD